MRFWKWLEILLERRSPQSGAPCRVLFLMLLLCGCLGHGVASPPATLDSAAQAAFNNEYSRARALYAEVAVKATDAEARETALVALANIEWRIEGQDDAARSRLEALGTFRALLEESRLELDRGRYDAAGALARRATALARDKVDRRKADLAWAGAIVKGHVKTRLVGDAPPETDLGQAFNLLRRLADDNRGRLRFSHLYLDAALILGRGDAALDAWKSYFGAAMNSGMLAPVALRLESLLPSWRGEKSPELADALAASRLFDEAVLTGAGPQVAAWDVYLLRVRDLTNAYYRDVANGRGGAHAYRRELAKLTMAVCKELGVECDDKTIEGEPAGPLYDRFGAILRAGMTGSTFNLHLGHAVLDDRRPVSQYGRSATLRYIVLDTMVSNGFESWSWDGGAQHGGWGEPGLMVQVRPAYAELPVTQWEQLMDEDQRKDKDEEIARETDKDWSRAAADPFCYLPGLRARLVRESGLGLMDELSARSLSGHALEEAFIQELAQRMTESSIFAHEGRHAIDREAKAEWQTWLTGGSSQAEFQAKLSEMAFAPDPKIALTGGILADNIGSKSPHGLANRRIMQGLVEWMAAHKAEIAGLDPGRPLLPQLDQLTDNQIRAVARGLDPLAKHADSRSAAR